MKEYVGYQAGEYFIRFQDTEGFQADYHSCHNLWNPEVDDFSRDTRLDDEVYQEGSDTELKEGWVFAFNDPFEEGEKIECWDSQVTSDDYAIQIELKEGSIVYNLDDMGYLINLKDAVSVKSTKIN